jgi:hypothetical protein
MKGIISFICYSEIQDNSESPRLLIGVCIIENNKTEWAMINHPLRNVILLIQISA